MRKLIFTPLVTAILIGLFAIPTMAYSTVVKPANPTDIRWSNTIFKWYSIPVTPTPAPAPTPKPTPVTPVPTTSPVSQLSLTQDEQLIVNLVNQERAKAGLQPLKVNFKLVKVARLKAQDMVKNKYFSHTSPTYGSPFDVMKAEGINYRYAGENIAGNSTASRAMTAWMQSAGHRANILNPNFTHIGVGVGYQASPYNIYVQEFTQER